MLVYKMWLCHFIALLKATDDQQKRYDKIAAYVCIILFFILLSVFAAAETLVCVCLCVVCVYVCVFVYMCMCVCVCVCVQCVYTCICVCVHACVRVCVDVCVICNNITLHGWC